MKPNPAADTPMMRQYLELKAQVPGALLLYRMGDFYELFFDDALEAAQILELTVTSRNKNDPDPIPMAGIPYHALEGYLRRLVDVGRKVAIAEQRVDEANPKLMTRELVRVVTPGLPWDGEAALEARESCWLAGAAGHPRKGVGLALLESSTGELRLTELPDAAALAAELERVEPRELVLSPALAEAPELAPLLARLAHTVPEVAWFDPDAGRQSLCRLLKTRDLMGFGAADLHLAIGAAGALISYARDTARVRLDHVTSVQPYTAAGCMVMDEATRRNLEILRPLWGGGRKGSLLGLLDRTCTAMGGRLLRAWIASPLVELAAIRARQDAVESLWSPRLREVVRAGLIQVADLERLSGKVAQATANARDLLALAQSLSALPAVFAALAEKPAFHKQIPKDLCPEIAADVLRWIVEEPPAALTEGGLIKPGLDKDLDELTTLSREGKTAMAKMEVRERDRTGISSLRVKHNSVFGYFLEVTSSNLHKVPKDWIRKQTLVNAERYITPELKEFEEKVLGAEERRKALELELFRALRDRVAAAVPRLQRLAAAVAYVDVAAALAEVAVENRYVRPEVHAGTELEIVGGRHPVIEALSRDEPFVPNDVRLDAERRLIILTGPNMAGKSTVMRQVGLIALMAQIGSFVPAKSAKIGLCDRVFVRVGASDDLSRGRSTFMVEMSETALILNQATSRSLILLDEIGRGTSTYDGLAIAWAVAEAVHDRLQARALFATHYHELVSLGEQLPRACNQHIAVSEWQDQVIFLRTLRAGGASKSYGIQCARLAGMPDAVVERATVLLRTLEHGTFTIPGEPSGSPAAASPAPAPAPSGGAAPPDPLGAAAPAVLAEPAFEAEDLADDGAVDAIREVLSELDPDAITPRQALDLLYHLRELLAREAVVAG